MVFTVSWYFYIIIIIILFTFEILRPELKPLSSLRSAPTDRFDVPATKE